MARLPEAFFARPSLEVAPDLLGCWLVHGGRAGRIVEVEAYLGDGSDPASHAHGGLTQRNRAMFGPPGHFYVYRSMGLHECANVVCEPPGRAAAVLLRAVEPLAGLAAMRAARGGRADRELANGPGKLTRAFGFGLERDGRCARSGAVRIEPPDAPPAEPILAGPRVGISKAVDLPWRFFLAGHPGVTRSPLNRAAHPLPR